MLAEEDKHGMVEHVDVAIVRLACRFSFVVCNGQRQISVLETAFQQTVTKVDVLTVHEEVLIQQTYLVESRVA